ncbi:hypothetical protein PIECOFPK_01946 [Mycovorax composti]|jgi:hypothetical protein
MKRHYPENTHNIEPPHPQLFLQIPVCFTGNAITYLSSERDMRVNLDEWEWHEEIIDGEVYCIVTDRRNAEKPDRH